MHFLFWKKVVITCPLRLYSASRILETNENTLLSFKFETINVSENNVDVNINDGTNN